MTEQEIRIVNLAPMRVASAHGFGESPEEEAFAKIQAFAEEKGLLVNGKLPPTYGFNNPNPSPGSPNYGYEVWLPVDESIEPAGEINIVNFTGGQYAVASCVGLQNIGSEWMALAKWREKTSYGTGKHQWLEHLLTAPDSPLEQFEFDLYLPISE